jgi:tyrosine decarboxylase
MLICKIDYVLIQDRSALIQSLSTNPEFLKNKVGFYLHACSLYLQASMLQLKSLFICVLIVLNLQASEGNMVIDYKDWQIPLGRRFRSVF